MKDDDGEGPKKQKLKRSFLIALLIWSIGILLAIEGYLKTTEVESTNNVEEVTKDTQDI